MWEWHCEIHPAKCTTNKLDYLTFEGKAPGREGSEREDKEGRGGKGVWVRKGYRADKEREGKKRGGERYKETCPGLEKSKKRQLATLLRPLLNCLFYLYMQPVLVNTGEQ